MIDAVSVMLALALIVVFFAEAPMTALDACAACVKRFRLWRLRRAVASFRRRGVPFTVTSDGRAVPLNGGKESP